MSGPPFIHLRLHSQYSLVDSVVRIPDLIQAVEAGGMPAVAVTDRSNLFAVVKFYRAALSAGLKPIIGADVQVESPALGHPVTAVLLITNHDGYRNLSSLLSRAFRRGQVQGQAVIAREALRQHNEGLIALSGAAHGEVGKLLLDGRRPDARAVAREWMALFPNSFYLELQRTARDGEEAYVAEALELARELSCPVVATNDVRYLRATDFEAHEARVCIAEGGLLNDPTRQRKYSEYQYLRTPAEMAELFADVPEALRNSVEIAIRCNLELEFDQPALPDFPTPLGQPETDYLRNQAEVGLRQRFTDSATNPIPTAYWERLQYELEIICAMGFAGYFLIVADFIRWARDNQVPVGPGRGSGAGSLVAYALRITDLDPLHYDLLFERFLNSERVSLPDFDIDFCMEGRDRVIEYVAAKYGADKVCQIITFGSMAAKAVVRDVGRVMGFPYGYVDRIAKLIPFEVGMTLDKALADSDELRERYQQDEELASIVDLAKSLEGLARNAGTHAGGVVIAPTALTDYTPLYTIEGSEGVVTQLDKDDIEAIGLVKFDFLGLRTLTIIDRALQLINHRRQQQAEPAIEIAHLELDDNATFALLKRCETTAVFQLESRGIRDLIRRLRPDCFEDIVALVALFRPGPLQSGMVEDFIDRKHGRASVNYPHPALEPILRSTYGVILYQEQVMQIAQVLAGYTLGRADLLRRAMGKKKPEEMARHREIFCGGAEQAEVPAATASYIFDLMEKFAGYGFNKSHSVAYALLAYQTAWLKAHFPAAFMCSVLSADMDHTDKIVVIIDECRRMGLTVMAPDINNSDYYFSVVSERSIVYGLGAIKGVGRAAIDSLLQQRAAEGPYVDLADLCTRLDNQRINRRVLEALIRAGALDKLGVNRASLMAELATTLQAVEQQQRAQHAGQSDMFGEVAAASAGPELTATTVLEWDDDIRLRAEKEALGLYLTGHPIDRFRVELQHLTDGQIADIYAQNEKLNGRAEQRQLRVAGLVVNLRMRNLSDGRLGIATLDDGSGRLEIVVGAEVLETSGAALSRDAIVVAQGSFRVNEFSGEARLRVSHLMTLTEARARYAKCLYLRLNAEQLDSDKVAVLKQQLMPYRDGSCPVILDYASSDFSVRLKLGDDWTVCPHDKLLEELRQQFGADGVRLEF